MDELQAITPIQPIREAVYEQLKKAIRSGAYKVGERLLEHDLAARLQVSRTPVREALHRLAAEGLLEAQPKQGLVVKAFSDDDVREIYIIREALESLAAEFAAINATDRDIAELEELVTKMDTLDIHKDAVEEMRVHRHFSEAYNRASHMPTLIRLTESLKDQLLSIRNVSLGSTARRRATRKEHGELLQALKLRDPKLASELTREHIQHALTAYFTQKEEYWGKGAEKGHI